MRLRLIGPPQLVADDGVRRVRGFQVWAVLVRVLLSERPVTRRELAADLFPETADPLGSVRWCLAAARRALDAPGFLTGDPLEVELPEGLSVDLLDLADGRLDLSGLGELLEGVTPRSSPEFELWLLVQRQRVASRIDAVLRNEVLAAAARGDVDRALTLAEVAARRQPLDESAQVLLVSSLRQAGRHRAADDAVDRIEARFVAELGAPPTSGVRNAARHDDAATTTGVSPTARALSHLEGGQAALTAGAVDAGIDGLRHATSAAELAGDDQLLGRCLGALGSALVHAVRSRDDEGALLLERAVSAALRAGDDGTAAAASRELGYVEALAGRRPAAEGHLARAESLAGTDVDLLASVRSVRAFNLTDWGRHDVALPEWEHALELARRSGDSRRLVWALGLGGWGWLRGGEPGLARDRLRECLDVVGRTGWIAFRPWPSAVLAEVELVLRGGAQVPDLQQEFSLSCQMKDPCWEGGTARALALTALAGGRPDQARHWIDEAGRRVVRESDAYVALQAAILATDIEVSRCQREHGRMLDSARSLLDLGARGHMDDHVERATAILREG